jgi:aminoglycoside 3-N-acetyltransferase
MKYPEHEFDVIKKTSIPNTVDSLKSDLRALGVKPASTIIMHSALSQIGWTIGGPVSVIKAVMEILTPEGTLVMPSFTGDNSEPSKWENPPVPQGWWEVIRRNMPAFQPSITPTRGMGIIAESFRNYPEVIRSDHPISSFAAWGKYAKKITESHELDSDLGENSPLARIYDLDGQILLIGVSHSNNSSLHLAEYRCEFKGKEFVSNGSAILVKNKRKWVVWNELNHNSDDFEKLGHDFETKMHYQPKKVGFAESRLLLQRKIVDFAVKWMRKNRV